MSNISIWHWLIVCGLAFGVYIVLQIIRSLFK